MGSSTRSSRAHTSIRRGSDAGLRDRNITAFEARSAKDALAAFARAVGSDVTMRAASLLVELRRGGDGRIRVNAAYDIELDAAGELALKPT